MTIVQVKIIATDKAISSRCEKALSFRQRLLGLIGRRNLADGEGMWFPQCGSIHMWFMKFPIDVVFMKKAGEKYRVTKLVAGMKPWSPLPAMSLSASDVIELPAGTIQKSELKVGDEICIN